VETKNIKLFNKNCVLHICQKKCLPCQKLVVSKQQFNENEGTILSFFVSFAIFIADIETDFFVMS
jgi:hypothetical protein